MEKNKNERHEQADHDEKESERSEHLRKEAKEGREEAEKVDKDEEREEQERLDELARQIEELKRSIQELEEEMKRHPFIHNDHDGGAPSLIAECAVFKTTYFKISYDKQELCGYAVDNSMPNADHFDKVEVDDSYFKKQVLELETVQAMNCWVVVEQVPTMWNSIDLHMLHIIYSHFDFVSAKIVVKVAPMSLGEELKQEGKWLEIYNEPFPSVDG